MSSLQVKAINKLHRIEFIQFCVAFNIDVYYLDKVMSGFIEPSEEFITKVNKAIYMY